jgi:hypothetical protein
MKRYSLFRVVSCEKTPEANADKPATVKPQNENGFAFLQALHFQNPLKLQQVHVLYIGL